MMKKIKIAYTIPNFDTAGSGKVVYDLVKGLDRTKYEPEIVVFHTKGAYFKEVEKLGVPIHVFKFETRYKPYISFLFRVLKISRFFKQQQFDIIHSWHWSSDFSEPLAAKLAGIPYVYTKKAMSWGNKAWVWRSQLSTKIVAINRDMMDAFFKTMPDKVINLPLGVDTNFFSPQEKDLNLQKELKIEKDDFVIVSVVNMVPVKGIEILLEAVKILDDKRIKVLIIGNDKSEYAESLKEKYASSEIQFLGKKIEVRPYIALGTIFVIPTKDEGRKEGMPIAPLEAMAMGVPVIGSKISGIKDILFKYPHLLFEPSNASDLALKIQEFRDSKDFNKKELLTMVQTHFSLDSFIRERENLYSNLVSK